MIKKQPVCLIIIALTCCFLTGCQVFNYFLDAITPFTQEDNPSPTITFEAITTSEIWTATPQIDITQVQPTATNVPPTKTPTPSSSLFSSFIPQEDTPVYLSNFAHPSAGCDWMGVAGQVFDMDGREIQELTIILGNTLLVEEQISAARTGLAPAYGPGGYEIQISEKPFNSNNSLWVQVIDLAGNAVSEKFFFDTFEDCNQNLILINFIPEVSIHDPALQSTPILEQDVGAPP